MVRVGIAGLGFMGRTHLEAYLRREDVEVVALADLDPARRRGEDRAASNIAGVGQAVAAELEPGHEQPLTARRDAVLKQCDDDPDTVRVRLTGDVPRIDNKGRNLLIVSSCGACGAEELDEKIDNLPVAGDTLHIEAALLGTINGTLRRQQSLFEACGGTHAVALFDAAGRVLSSAEDTGRHNALDKAVGKCLLEGVPTAGLGAALSGRVSLEMVTKCARAGIELITAISAPTSLAVEVADRCNITLCAFVRDGRATIFTHPGRISR